MAMLQCGPNIYLIWHLVCGRRGEELSGLQEVMLFVFEQQCFLFWKNLNKRPAVHRPTANYSSSTGINRKSKEKTSLHKPHCLIDKWTLGSTVQEHHSNEHFTPKMLPEWQNKDLVDYHLNF